MNDIFLVALCLIVILVLGAFGFTVLRMVYTMRQDDKIAARVNGLSIDMGKVKKALKDGYTNVVGQSQENVTMPVGMENMSIEDAAEMLGFDKKELNNPIFRPIAEKIFEAFKAKAAAQQQDEECAPEIPFI